MLDFSTVVILVVIVSLLKTSFENLLQCLLNLICLSISLINNKYKYVTLIKKNLKGIFNSIQSLIVACG